ncbi:hypothetical protein JRO89_XS12G0016000 [Xanthoceras sorbifolium]|uniref:Uncharacterized protein n=1 Tax=Xanthoceras sorbifolium TaxID=99658 RepID=A0ABQ8HAH2_9ROSI|nr:hypothetical protein JRO89_XS12G0016000 [Xanthoceras sorbifolium]
MQMDIQARIGSITSHTHRFLSRLHRLQSCSSYSYSPIKPCCSRGDSQEPQQNGGKNNEIDQDSEDHNHSFLMKEWLHRDKFSTDWDKAWSNFKKQGKKSLFSQFSPNKYVSWNPRRSNYPLSEEVDPIKRAEKSNLMLWTSPSFTLGGAIVIVTILLVYTILVPVK